MKPILWAEVLEALIARRDVSDAGMRSVLGLMMEGSCEEAEIAAFLMGLRMKGETAQEIAAAARVLREHMISWDPGCDVLDTCGTGGDGTGTFNISTAAALVAAGAGARIVKHGNRSVSSKSGSADVLAALGIDIEGTPESARRQLEQAGLAFCYAPRFHPALRHVAAVRRRLGFPTIFNCLGPLANPAGASRQLLGVGRADFVERMAEALAELGTTRSFVVCGEDGLDEVSLAAPTIVREVRGSAIRAFEWTADDFGLEPVALAELAAASAAASAALIERIVNGEEGPASRVVLANAAAALLVTGSVATLEQGVALAQEAIASGKAAGVLAHLRLSSKETAHER